MIKKNFFYRNKGEGILIAKLALTDLKIIGNEFQKNQSDNLKLKSIHHKVNKRYKIRIENNQIERSEVGYGANIFDTSAVIKNCIVKSNHNGGIFIACNEKPINLLPEALQFLKKYPMSVKVSGCNIT